MLPTPNSSTFFAADQDWLFRVRSWDTPQTVIENDVSSPGMQLRVYQPKSEQVDWTAYATALKAPGANAETAIANSTYAQAIVGDGRWPQVQAYWGSGTPNWWGGGRSGRVALSFRGTLVSAARRAWLSASNSFTFALAGSGWARIDVVEGGTTTTLFSGDLSESIFLGQGFLYSTTRTLAENAELRIYYVQTRNDPWGGLVVKAIPGTRPTDASTGGPIARAAAAEAPVVSCGLFSYGDPVNATTGAKGVPAVELPFIVSATINQDAGAATRADIEIPLVNPDVNDGSGWMFVQQEPTDDPRDPGKLEVYDNGTLTHTLKRKRLIQIQVARREANPTWLPIFTGHVDDFGSGSNGRLTIQAVSFEGRMVEQYEQAPDRVSYMARGFQVLDYRDAAPTDRKQPVYNVPAFDNWPLAWAIEELGMRAGIDPSCFRKTWTAVQPNGTGTTVQLPWGTGKRFRAEALNGELIRMPRPVHYGNVGLSFTEDRPYDDEYLFKVEPTKDLWARARELSDRLGYVCRFDVYGGAVLYPAYSPSFVSDLAPTDATSGTATAVINPAAYGAKYLSVAGSATLQKVVRAARIDVSFPRVTGAKNWTVTVTPVGSATPVITKTITPAANTETPELFFNSSVAAPGTGGRSNGNATVFTIYSGEYREYTVALSTSGSGSGYVDCILAYAQDPDTTTLPTLSTNDAASSVVTKAQQDAVRNKVTIVGRRKAAATDSDKFAEAQAPTEQEFVVQNAVDVNSIVDPTASNYVGYLKQSLIYDDSIADDGLARYLAQVFIYRQSVPRAGASVSHTLLPMLELNDPIAVEESKYETAKAAIPQYVRKITHQISANKFTTNLESEPWPEYPAYQPRVDINLADFDNKPITDLQIAYTSLSGHPVTNPSPDEAKLVPPNAVTASNVAISGNALSIPGSLPWPPVPGTFQLKPNYGSSGTTRYNVESLKAYVVGKWQFAQRVQTFQLAEDWFVVGVAINASTDASDDTGTFNLFYDIPAASESRDGYFYYEESDGLLSVYRGKQSFNNEDAAVSGEVVLQYQISSGDARLGWLANNPYHRFVQVNYQDSPGTKVSLPWEQLTSSTIDDGIASFNIRYRSLYPAGEPYPTIGGVKFSPFYDPYTSELGNLVSFKFSVLAEGMYRVSVRNWDDNTVVAWLTNTAADPTKPESHWEYIPIMADREFTWDGVDQLGLWNGTQSELYSELVEGTFEEGKRPRVGRGFYCWNQELSGGNLGPLAYIWMARNGDGTPIIGHGTFARWYLHVEAETATEAEREVSSKEYSDSDSYAVLTHLPEPTKLELKISDFSGGSWITPPTLLMRTQIGAHINSEKPVRIRFKAAQRPGALWASKNGEVSVKLTREVHLRAVIGDQTVVFRGVEFPGTTVEDRAVYNRRLVNDEHTKQYVDTGYRKAKSFKWDDATDGGDAVTEWVFYPQDFKKDFQISGYEEPLEFGNYLQLEEVPEWNGARAVSSARSRLNFALMSYLFYLSAYVTDRSGRSSWGINRSFVDKSKINTNNSTTDWPTDPMYEQRRTIVCRQWTSEPTWKSSQFSKFGYGSNTLFDKLLEAFWYQHDITATTIGAQSPAQWDSFGLVQDAYSQALVSASDFKVPSIYGTNHRLLGNLSGGMPVSSLGNVSGGGSTPGTWSWESNPTWIPSITRDLHPYFMLPPMVSPPRPEVSAYPGREVDYRKINCYWTIGGPDVTVTYREWPGKNTFKDTKASDAGAAETWTSPIVDYTGSNKRFWPGFSVNIKEGPFKGDTLASNVLNYVRQDEMVHYEDLRGIYSRSKYPVSSPVKVAPAGAYYLNPYRYTGGIEVWKTMNESSYPQFHAVVGSASQALGIEWFRIAFRSEYLWESGSMFPTTRNGKERLEGVLWWRHRFVPLANSLFYDYGAWTGWKDDDDAQLLSQIMGGTKYKRIISEGPIQINQQYFGSPFTTGYMPVGVGPVLPQTMELVSHLVLVPERRGS